MTNGRMKLVSLAAIALLFLGLAGCSSDGGGEDAGGDNTEATSTTEAADDEGATTAEESLVGYQSMDIADGIATLSLTAACPDGRVPEDVTMAFGDPVEQLGAFDNGDGEFTISVEVDPDATEEELVDELGLNPEDLGTTFTATCP